MKDNAFFKSPYDTLVEQGMTKKLPTARSAIISKICCGFRTSSTDALVLVFGPYQAEIDAIKVVTGVVEIDSATYLSELSNYTD